MSADRPTKPNSNPIIEDVLKNFALDATLAQSKQKLMSPKETMNYYNELLSLMMHGSSHQDSFNSLPIQNYQPNSEPIQQGSSNTELIQRDSPNSELIQRDSPNSELIQRDSPNSEPTQQDSPNSESIQQGSPNEDKVGEEEHEAPSTKSGQATISPKQVHDSLYADPDLVTCLICNQSFHMITSPHLAKHECTVQQYKTRFNIPRSTKLVSQNVLESRKERIQRTRIWEHTQKNTSGSNQPPADKSHSSLEEDQASKSPDTVVRRHSSQE